jgi:diaminohydroxyphosphoribosylaminopyrimidine deaminase / 5-amino-6-(5-phosphoribosylamino)uracil reductase
VLLKWAQTRDGFVARSDYDSKWISNAHSRQLVHRWRAEEDAVLVGTKTAHFDNPRLNVRDWCGRDPLRIVIDMQLTLDPNSYLFDQTQPTICYNLIRTEKLDNLEYAQLPLHFQIGDLLADLHRRKVQSVLVEGGSILLQHFIRQDLWDEARVFTGDVSFGNGIPSPHLNRVPNQTFDIIGDRLDVYYQ